MSVITLTIKTKMYKLLFFFFAFQRVVLKVSTYQQGNPHLYCKGNILVFRGLSV